jgi:hypothetical protein
MSPVNENTILPGSNDVKEIMPSPNSAEWIISKLLRKASLGKGRILSG